MYGTVVLHPVAAAESLAPGRIASARTDETQDKRSELRDVPPIASPAAESTSPGTDPDGKAATDKRGKPVTKHELMDQRRADRQVFEKSDGKLEVQFFPEPRFFERAPGDWADVDTKLKTDGDSRRSGDNSWHARFHGSGDARGAAIVETAAGSVGLRPRTERPVEPVDNADSHVTYKDLWRSADLGYEVRSASLKEEVVVKRGDAPSRYEFDVVGASAAIDGNGLVLKGAAGDLRVPAPAVLSSTDEPLPPKSGIRYEVLDDGKRVALVVNDGWLASLPAATFPIKLDPTIDVGSSGTTVEAWSNTGAYSNDGTVWIGKSGWGTWRSQMHIPYEQYLTGLPGSWGAWGAKVQLKPYAGDAGGTRQGVSILSTTTPGFAGAAPPAATAFPRGIYANPAVEEAPDQIISFYLLQDEVTRWLTGKIPDERFSFTGDESSFAAHRYEVAAFTLELSQQPPVTTVNEPADGAVLATRTPTLTLNPLTWQPTCPPIAPTCNLSYDNVYYWFEVSTSRGAGTGNVIYHSKELDSTTPLSQTIPPGVLRDGATYYVRVLTGTVFLGPVIFPPASTDHQFRIDLNLGFGGVSPKEEAGTVLGVAPTPAEGSPMPSTAGAKATVNLVNGNLAVAVPTHKVTATGGDLSPSLVYNSRGEALNGLDASYYSDNGDAMLDVGGATPPDHLSFERADSQIATTWSEPTPGCGCGISRISPTITTGAVFIRWRGFIQAPTSPGTWALGIRPIGSMTRARMYLANRTDLTFGNWSDPNPADETIWGGSMAASGARVPIVVEAWITNGGTWPAGVELHQTHPSVPSGLVPPDWLSRSPRGLPQGWQLATGAGRVDWNRLEDRGDVVVVRGSDGSSAGFTRTPTGGYSPPVGSSDLLSVSGDGQFALETADHLLYRFRADGQLELVTSIQDDLHPAAFRFTYSGTPAQLSAIADPVSGRQVLFDYGGNAAVPCTAPASMLCRIRFWDATETDLSYDGSGRLITVTNPSGAFADGTTRATRFDFGYDTASRIASVRDPLANDAIAFGKRTADGTERSAVGYDSQGRVSTFTQAAPEATGSRPGSATYT